MLDVQLIQNSQQFDTLAEQWDGLVADCDHDSPFRRWSWMRTWWSHYGEDQQLFIIAVHEDDNLIGIAPLFIQQQAAHVGTRSLQFLGTGQACAEYLGFIIRSGCEQVVVPAILESLTTTHVDRWDVMRLTDIPAESLQLDEFAAFCTSRNHRWSQRTGTTNLVIDFPGDWDVFLKSISSKRRTKLRRVVKTFERDFEGQFEMASTPSEYEHIWPELERLHNLHWSDAGQQGCFETPAFQKMHRELSQQYLESGQLVLASLQVDATTIAACYGFRQGDTIYEYQRGHDPDWLTHRPGHALQYYMFEQLMTSGVRHWDYLRGDYQHKRDWATDTQTTIDIFAAAPRCLATSRYFAEHSYRNLRRRLKTWRDRAKSHS